VVNNSWRLAPWADVLYACDAKWWRHYGHEVNGEFTGECWTIDREYQGTPGMNQIDGVDLPGLSSNPKRIHTGGNGGYQALGLAVLWGVKRIILLGYDMGATNGRSHWHPDHPRELGNPCMFESWRRRMAVAAADLRRMDVECVNASASSALMCFERVDLCASLS
jgi:hypothetical protein